VKKHSLKKLKTTTAVIRRAEYNKDILEKCVDLLQSHNAHEKYEGVISAAYLIEQTFKSVLAKLNPLLCVDRNKVSEESEIKMILKKLSNEELKKVKTVDARKCVAYVCAYKKDLQQHKANFDELFDIRNYILHSTDDFFYDADLASETAVSALRACQKYIAKHLQIEPNDFNPLTSQEFNDLQEKERKQRITDLQDLLKEHKKLYKKLTEKEVEERQERNTPETDSMSWIEETLNCPACNYDTLDHIVSVDFEWNDGMVTGGSGSSYLCRVCELELSEYEYNMADSIPVTPILKK